MNTNKSIDWTFVSIWTIAGIFSLALFGAAAFATMWSVSEIVTQAAGEALGLLVAGLLFGGLFSLGFSLSSGLLLRRHGINMGRWVSRSALAAALITGLGLLSFSLFGNFMEQAGDITNALIIGVFLGLPMGVVQWQLLKDAGISADLWPAILLVAWFASLAVSMPLGAEGREWLSLVATGVLVSGLSGLGMSWLLATRPAPLAA